MIWGKRRLLLCEDYVSEITLMVTMGTSNQSGMWYFDFRKGFFNDSCFTRTTKE